MTEPMFDPVLFPPPPEKRGPKVKTHPDELERVPVGDDRWQMTATHIGVDSVAHIIVSDSWGTAAVLCRRLRGRPIPLQGTRPVACPRCRELSSQ
jgi:hypothetical protein